MGRVYWITGLSGAGKTTIAEALLKAIREAGQSAVFLDGDQLREVFGRREAYQREDRLDLALQYARLCKMLSEQGLTVICAIWVAVSSSSTSKAPVMVAGTLNSVEPPASTSWPTS